MVMMTALLLAAVLAVEDPKTDPNAPVTFTQAGWLQVFDGQSLFGWQVRKGEVKPANGTLVFGTPDKESEAYLTTEFGDQLELAFEWTAAGTGPKVPWVEFKREQGKHVTRMGLTPLPADSSAWYRSVYLVKYDPARRTYTVRDSLYQGDKLLFSNVQSSSGGERTESRTAIGFEVPPGLTLTLRNVHLRPLGLTPIFNGKDLTGWRETADGKARFQVSPKGELTVDQGPGELRTAQEWGDLVLLVDGRATEVGLAGGVVVRGRDGAAGLTALIRNQFQDAGQAVRPVEYTPGGVNHRPPINKTHVGDTGEVRYVQLIVAHGNHLAVWVNGYQVADVTLKDGQAGRGFVGLQAAEAATQLRFGAIKAAALAEKSAQP
jgi:hypothetical protein